MNDILRFLACFFSILACFSFILFCLVFLSKELDKEKKEIISNSENFTSYEHCTKLFDVWYCEKPIIKE